MPTRLYLPQSNGSPGISPTPDAEWENTASVVRVVPTLTASGVACSTHQPQDSTATANRDTISRQFVYPLDAGIAFSTTDTFKCQVLAWEDNALDNVRSQIIIRVLASDGTTVRATLYAGDLETLTGNPSQEWNTAQRNAKFPRAGTVNLAANYTTVSGDYLVIEIGYRKHSVRNITPQLRYCTNNANDLGENETDTGNLNTWIEFSRSLTDPGMVILSSSNLALGNTTVGVSSGSSVAETTSTLTLGNTTATLEATADVVNDSVNLTKSDLALGNTSLAVASSSSVSTSLSDLALGNTTVALGAFAPVTLTVSTLSLGNTDIEVTHSGLATLTTSTLSLGNTSLGISSGSLVETTVGDLALGNTTASLSAGEVVVTTSSDLTLGTTTVTVSSTQSDSVSLVVGELTLDSTALAIQANSLVTLTGSTLDLQGTGLLIHAGASVILTSTDLTLGSTDVTVVAAGYAYTYVQLV